MTYAQLDCLFELDSLLQDDRKRLLQENYRVKTKLIL